MFQQTPGAEQRITISVLVLIAALILLPLAGASEPEARPLNIIFFGNSLTAGNSVPQLVAAVAMTAGQAGPQVFSQTPGGATLGDHLKNPGTDILITQSLPPGEVWDFAVIQEQSYKPSAVGTPNEFRKDAVDLFDRVRAHSPNAVCTLFENWARNEGGWPYPPYFKIADMLADIRNSTALARDDINAHAGGAVAQIAPIGSAWEFNGWNQLHQPDRVHATARGSLLASLVIYRRIYVDDTNDIPASSASALLNHLGLTAVEWTELTTAADAVDELPAPLVHIYCTGNFVPGGELKIMATGPAGATPVAFWFSPSLRAQPWPTVYGDFFLAPPLRGPIDMGVMASHNKVAYTTTVPLSPPGPYTVHLQALSGAQLTYNSFRLDVN